MNVSRDHTVGASFSLKQCRNFETNPKSVLKAALVDLGCRRFRIMSYWDEHEKSPGKYDFKELDWQLELVGRYGGEVSLCLGVRQPRWPESHWPEWTKPLSKQEKNHALFAYVQNVVDRYKDMNVIVEWQLENEALLKDFGLEGDFDRQRIRNEFKLVRSLDSTRPIIMTTSTSWGIPMRSPIPDIVGFSYYRRVFNKGAYRNSIWRPVIFKIRALLIRILWRKPVFMHEVQAEPWGPRAIWEMPINMQDESMNIDLLNQNIELAKSTGLLPIDLWGLEWWYWRKINGDDQFWKLIKEFIAKR